MVKGRVVARTPMRLLTGVMDRGATTAEVYWKEGRSIRFALSASAELTESHVEERGVAVRAWGPAGGMAFASFIPDDDACSSHALEGIRMQMLGPGEGPPTLPCSPPHELTPDGDDDSAHDPGDHPADREFGPSPQAVPRPAGADANQPSPSHGRSRLGDMAAR